MKTLTNPFFVDMEKGARKAESELNVKLIVKTGAQEPRSSSRFKSSRS